MRKTPAIEAALSEMERALTMSNYTMTVMEVDSFWDGKKDLVVALARIEKTRFTPAIRFYDNVLTCSFALEANINGTLDPDEVQEMLREYGQANGVLNRLSGIARKHGIATRDKSSGETLYCGLKSPFS